MASADSPEQFRRLVGATVKQYREERGMSQGELAERLAISYQQVQKYESGSSRLSVDRIYQLAHALHISYRQLLPIEDESQVREEARPIHTGGSAHLPKESPGYRLDGEELRVLKLFRRIKSQKLRRNVITYLRTVGDSDRSYGDTDRESEDQDQPQDRNQSRDRD